MLRLFGLFVITLFETIFARVSHGRLLPSWGFQFEWVVRFLRRDALGAAKWPYPKLRADYDRGRYPGLAVSKVKVETRECGAVPVVTFTPPGAAAGALVVFFHGGSYVFGSPRSTHADLIARFAFGVRSVVVAPEYRLAPEHPYPAALEDARKVVSALRAEHPNARLVVAGDSAGGNLALAVQLALRDGGERQADAAVLISPWLDLSANEPSCRENERYDFGHSSFLLPQARAFAGEISLADARVSPFYARLEGLGPLFIQVGDAERLRDEGVAFAARTQAAGVETVLDLAPELPHLPPLFADFHPAGARAFDAATRYLRRALRLE
jgi:acetyl esterase/lipase